MTHGSACEQQRAQVLGRALLALVESVDRDNVSPFFEDHGLSDIQPDEWYALEDWLGVLRDMTDKGTVWVDYVSAGRRMVEAVAPLPPFPASSIDQIGLAGNQVYRALHRGEPVGEYVVERVNDRHLKVVVHTPYPCDFDYGICYAHALNSLPPGTTFRLWYDNASLCGVDARYPAIIHIAWT
ncbi:MAG: hypothetical protein GYB65_17495 [Chloroflexi bacterium]|nr:hypothetical protein [Chloroflexota bacterium]